MALIASTASSRRRTTPSCRARLAWRRSHRLAAWAWLVALTLVAARSAAAQPGPEGHVRSGLSGAGSLLAPNGVPGTVLASSLGYGLTESFGPHRGLHQRAFGTLGLAHTPLPWLSLSAHVQGRLDVHPDDARGSDRTGTGDPYLTVRAGHPLSPHTRLGAALSVWVPGLSAPSLVFTATTPELRALYAYDAPTRHLHLLANLGFRLDRSARAAPERGRLRYGDRSALGLSDAHGVPWGIALVYDVRTDLSAFAELSGLLLARAKVIASSPTRVAVGLRHFARHGLELEAGLTLSVAPKPSFLPSAPLVPFEPRALLHVALRWSSTRAQARLPEPATDDGAAARATAARAEVQPPHRPRVVGHVLDEHGSPLPDTRVVLTLGERVRETVSAFDGSFEFAELDATGAGSLTLGARGYAPRALALEVRGADLVLPAEQLEPALGEGLIRLQIRAFSGDALAADVVIENARGKKLVRTRAPADGALEASLPPGTYRITATARGFRTQHLSVRVAADEVSIVNVDLHERR